MVFFQSEEHHVTNNLYERQINIFLILYIDVLQPKTIKIPPYVSFFVENTVLFMCLNIGKYKYRYRRCLTMFRFVLLSSRCIDIYFMDMERLFKSTDQLYIVPIILITYNLCLTKARCNISVFKSLFCERSCLLTQVINVIFRFCKDDQITRVARMTHRVIVMRTNGPPSVVRISNSPTASMLIPLTC